MAIKDYKDHNDYWDGEYITGYHDVDFFIHLSKEDQNELVTAYNMGLTIEYFNPASREWEVVIPIWEPYAAYRLKEICDDLR